MSRFTKFVTSFWSRIGSLFRRITQRSPEHSMEVNYKSDSNREIGKFRAVLDAHAEMILARFEIDRIGKGIGKGAFGEVYAGIKEHNLYALKIQKVFHTETALSEIELLKRVQHNNVVKLFDHMFVGGHIVIKFEYLNTTLEKLLKSVGSLTLEESLLLAKHLGSAVTWMHQHRITHNDIQSHNIMCNLNLNKDIKPQLLKITYKLIDFGCAIFHDTNNAEGQQTDFQTKYYCGTERLLEMTHDRFVSDSISVGAILLESKMNPRQLDICMKNSLNFGDVCDNFRKVLQYNRASKNDFDYLEAIRTLLSQEASGQASLEKFNERIRQFEV